MKILSINFNTNQKTQKNPGLHRKTTYLSNSISNDSFVKSKNNISFEGSGDNKDSIQTRATNVLTGIGIIGVPFLISVGVATAFARGEDPEDIFLSDGTYIGNTNDPDFMSEYITADKDHELLKIDGAGIDLDPGRFTSSNFSKGIFVNPDKNIDIDLAHKKYIDPENGIYIDPENKVSAIKVDGHYQEIKVPNFSFGTSMDPRDHFILHPHEEIKPEEYEKETGITPPPEMIDPDGMVHTTSNMHIAGNPIDELYDKVKEYITGDKEFVRYNELQEPEKYAHLHPEWQFKNLNHPDIHESIEDFLSGKTDVHPHVESGADEDHVDDDKHNHHQQIHLGDVDETNILGD